MCCMCFVDNRLPNRVVVRLFLFFYFASFYLKTIEWVYQVCVSITSVCVKSYHRNETKQNRNAQYKYIQTLYKIRNTEENSLKTFTNICILFLFLIWFCMKTTSVSNLLLNIISTTRCSLSNGFCVDTNKRV